MIRAVALAGACVLGSCAQVPPGNPNPRVMEWAARCLTAGNACAGDMYRLPGQKWQLHGRVGQASMTHLYEEVRHPGTIEDVMELDSSIDPAAYKAAAMEAFDR